MRIENLTGSGLDRTRVPELDEVRSLSRTLHQILHEEQRKKVSDRAAIRQAHGLALRMQHKLTRIMRKVRPVRKKAS